MHLESKYITKNKRTGLKWSRNKLRITQKNRRTNCTTMDSSTNSAENSKTKNVGSPLKL